MTPSDTQRSPYQTPTKRSYSVSCVGARQILVHSERASCNACPKLLPVTPVPRHVTPSVEKHGFTSFPAPHSSVARPLYPLLAVVKVQEGGKLATAVLLICFFPGGGGGVTPLWIVVLRDSRAATSSVRGGVHLAFWTALVLGSQLNH